MEQLGLPDLELEVPDANLARAEELLDAAVHHMVRTGVAFVVGETHTLGDGARGEHFRVADVVACADHVFGDRGAFRLVREAR